MTISIDEILEDLISIPNSQFPIPNSQFPIPNSQFPIPNSQFPIPKMSHRNLRIEVTVNTSQPELLEGLDAWLRLGLISDEQVRQLSQRYLVSRLPA
ncbi:MAG: DUF2157 domain-containing protein, partial [Symploca sp. SIO3E6]|nr:DUF2157 domain-containing protein [Caldora sp. SIO3E6]